MRMVVDTWHGSARTVKDHDSRMGEVVEGVRGPALPRRWAKLRALWGFDASALTEHGAKSEYPALLVRPLPSPQHSKCALERHYQG
jgi:hypothetical protein